MSMFCYQCQETAKNTGCTVKGVCGKSDKIANLQDMLLFVCEGLGYLKDQCSGDTCVSCNTVGLFITESIFATITNANFDENYFYDQIIRGITLKEGIRSKISASLTGELPDAVTYNDISREAIDLKSTLVGVMRTDNEDIRSLRELLVYGLKGVAAYAHHAYVQGYTDIAIFDFMSHALASVIDDSLTADDLFALVVKCGEIGVTTMALLDKANTTSYGNPEISEVNLGVRNNPGILISGHDLKDMEELLKQTEGSGVDVYTHGEMLPANYYPSFKKYKHFVGNYGNGWWKQVEEFDKFNGPVLLTTNCLIPPKEHYKDRIYTTGIAGFDGCTHIADRAEGKEKDFSQLIEHAKKCASPTELETGTLVGGFAHAQVKALAGKVVDAVKSGAIKKFVVMAGCDGRQKGRNYYTDFANALPSDTVILTAGCAKFRYNKLPLGDIGGIPRILDAGQCNDSYSLVVTALLLKEAFGLDDINDLPIVYNIAWYEQKAVLVLLALLSLGVKNIHLGPTLPGFLSPNVVNILVDKFGIAPNADVESDIKTLIG